jgi:hypothetical protein
MLTCLLGDKPAERVVAHLPRLLPPSQNKHTWRTGRENESGCEIMKMPLQISTLILSPARSCRLAIGSCEAVVARGPLPLRAPAFGGVARAWKSRPSPCSNRTSRRCCPSRTRRRHYLPFLPRRRRVWAEAVEISFIPSLVQLDMHTSAPTTTIGLTSSDDKELRRRRYLPPLARNAR